MFILKKWLDQKDKVDFKIYDVTTWLTNYYKHILPNTSQSKSNQTRKLGQLKEEKRAIFFFKNHAENEAGTMVPDLFLFFKEALHEVKASGLQLSFNIFR